MTMARNRRPALLGGASAAAQAGAAQSAQAEALAERLGASSSDLLPLSAIRGRPGGDARQTQPDHVVALAESIAALGLLEPLVIDRQERLLAGAHRLAACRLLALATADLRLLELRRLAGLAPDVDPLPPPLADLAQRCQQLDTAGWQHQHPGHRVPVRRYAIDAEAEPGLALAVEAAENEKRRDYQPTEIQALAQRLREAGFVEHSGRPRQGERALRPALAAIVGRSERHLRRLLGEKGGQVSALSPVDVARSGLIRALQRALRHGDLDEDCCASCRDLLERLG